MYLVSTVSTTNMLSEICENSMAKWDQIKEALKIGVDGFLLDNMLPGKIEEAVALIRKDYKGKNVFIEASGGITLNNIIPYLKTGINAISIGALTHHAVSKDIKLDFIS